MTQASAATRLSGGAHPDDDVMSRVIGWSVDRPVAVLGLAGALAVAGLVSFARLPLDAVPDLTNVQVQINTPVPALAPTEIEQSITVPLEIAMFGLPGMTELRSLSQPGISQMTLVFRDGTSIYRARQLVAERLATVDLAGGQVPAMGPIATGLGDIVFYALRDDTVRPGETEVARLGRLHTFHEWVVAPRIRATPGLAEIITIGGLERELQVRPAPGALAASGRTYADVVEAVEAANGAAGGGYVERSGERATVRTRGRVQSPQDVLDASLATDPLAPALRVGDVAVVGWGGAPRVGAATRGGDEAVLGTAKMLAGENSRDVSRRTVQRIREISADLPAGMALDVLYDRSELVARTLHTVRNNLFEGAVLVTAVLLVFLKHLSAALIVASAIPLSMLFAFTGMGLGKLSGNLMSLGAIDFGLIVDGAVIVVENCVRRIGEQARRLGRPLSRAEVRETVRSAAVEIRRAAGFGELIIMMVYLPVFALGGLEAKMFTPMAATVCLALTGAFALSFTVIPAVAGLVLSGRTRDEEFSLLTRVRRWYAGALERVLGHTRIVLATAVLVCALAGVLFTRLGGEFMPELDEGDLVLQVLRPPSVGLDRVLAMQRKTDRIVLEFAEVRNVFTRIGTNDPMDPMSLAITDLFIMLKPRAEWPRIDGRRRTKAELSEAIQAALAARIAGQSYAATQPIKMRFDELLEGARADIVVKIFGPEYLVLNDLATKVKGVLDAAVTVPGGEVEFEPAGNTPTIEIVPERAAMLRHGVRLADLNEAVGIALGGREAGELVVPGEPPVPIVVRMPEDARGDDDRIAQIPVSAAGGGSLPLGRVATIEHVERVNTIVRELGQRRLALLVNLESRDLEGFVRNAKEQLKQAVPLPEGYRIEWGGQFEHLESARTRLALVTPVVLGVVLLMVWAALRVPSRVAIVFAGIPVAAAGGVFALVLTGIPMSVSAGIGFIALSGVAVLNGLVLMGTVAALRDRGGAVREAVVGAARLRLRPVLMTALVASLGFLPMALARGLGAEVQRPLAAVVIGGLVTSTLLTLFVMPVLCLMTERGRTNRP